jgi:pyrroloquinoline quinone (PQQ) biosynthesis protein C
MKTIVLALSLIALATPSLAAPRSSLEKMCRELAGREEPEATDGKSHMGQLNVQRFSDCMMGAPR